MALDVAWNPWGLPALVAVVCAWGLAAVIFGARTDSVPNRRMAFQLYLEGIVVGVFHGGIWFITDHGTATGLVAVALVTVWIKLWTYFNFLATLDTPLARRIRPASVRYGFLALTLLLASTWFLFPRFYIGGIVPVPIAPWMYAPGTGFEMMGVIWATMWLGGLTFAISAARQARTDLGRRQARAYAIAFGFRDVAFALWVLTLILIRPDHPWIFHILAAPAIIWILYTLMVAYAILRTQLFDIEMRVKWTLRRSTLLTGLALVFFVAKEGIEAMLPVEGLLPNVAGAMVVATFAHPAWRLAGGLADRIMPHVDESESYIEARKALVYRAKVEEAFADGQVTTAERGIMLRLQEHLGMDAKTANRLEREVLETLGVRPA